MDSDSIIVEPLDDFGFNELSKDELIKLLKATINDRDKYKAIIEQKNLSDVTAIDFGSLGSSTVTFMRSENLSFTTPKRDLRQDSNIDFSTDVGTEHKKADELFKSKLVLEYEADSPSFSRKVDIKDKNVDDLRHHLQLLVQKCREYCNVGMSFSEIGKDFAFLISALQDESWTNRLGVLAPFLSKFGDVFEEIETFREAVLLSLETTFAVPMEEFVKREVKEVKKLKMQLRMCNDEYESALSKFLSLKVGSDDELILVRENELALLKNKCELCRYDLVTELNSLEMRKKFQLSERICAAMYTQLGFFHQCHTSVSTLEPAMVQLSAEISIARKNFSRENMLSSAKRVQLQRELDKSKWKMNSPFYRRDLPLPPKSKRDTMKDAMKSSTHILKPFSKAAHYTSKLGKNSLLSVTDSILTVTGHGHHAGADEQLQVSQLEDSKNRIVKAGYLRKKSHNFQKEWVRRWFFIRDGKFYYSRTDTSQSESQHICDLLISTVRENVDSEKRFTFEVISPGHRQYQLQGESQQDTDSWLAIIRQEIERSLGEFSNFNEDKDSHALSDIDESQGRNSTSFSSTNMAITLSQESMSTLKERNSTCAECGSPQPEWASINLGILICIECSGIHRSLGTHLSKVRSLVLDNWTYNTVQLLLRIGNSNSNSIWEGNLADQDVVKCVEKSTREEKDKFIRQKYQHRSFVIRDDSASSPSDINNKLFNTTKSGDLFGMIHAISCGADVNVQSISDGSLTPLHVACREGNVMCVELLCQWNARVDILDSFGKSPLDYSTEVSTDAIDSLVSKLESDLCK